MKERLKKIVFDTIVEFNGDNGADFKLSPQLKSDLIGPKSEIDSVALITLLVNIEKNVNKILKKKIVIADEKVFNDVKKIKTVGTLINHINSKI